MKIFRTATILLFLLAGATRADETMTRVVFHQTGPGAASGSFAAQSRTIYLYESTMGRVEEIANPVQHRHGLVIANGKDAWIINLWDKTGRHMVDPSPDHTFYAPIIPPDKPGDEAPVRDFELGRELAFMTAQGVSPQAATKNGKSYLLYQCAREGYTLRFYVSASSGTPEACEVEKNGQLIVQLIYTSYVSLPADPALFQPPPGIKISES
jgi:hypothetical protein